MIDDSLDGMTVNERLFASGLLDSFSAAARRRDRGVMVDLLLQTCFSREQATVDEVLQSPARYGF